MNDVPVFGKCSHRIRFGVSGRCCCVDGWSGVRHVQTCSFGEEVLVIFGRSMVSESRAFGRSTFTAVVVVSAPPP
jgi:hypothetical protein